MLIVIAAAAIAQAVPPSAPAQPITVIHAGTLIDVPGRTPRRNASILVQGRKIIEVRDGFAQVPGARVVDLRSSTVLPGLIDSHVHLGGLDDKLQARLLASSRNREDDAYTALTNARRNLLAGFTTVRELGGEAATSRALRLAINSGAYVGPTILMAGQAVSVSGGHGDDSNGLNRDYAEIAHRHATSVCNGPEDCRRATREQVRDGADVIKFTATGGVLSDVAGGPNAQMTQDEMNAIVQTARQFGRKVAAHAHGVDGINGALKAGVDSIEHGTFTNDETFRLYKQTGAYYVPTLLAFDAAFALGQKGVLTPAQFDKARFAVGKAGATFSRAVKEGVKIAFGTDTGVSEHGRNAQEFALMVRNGMTPADAIKSATVSAADLLGVSANAGTIAGGKDADIIAVEGDPLQNIRLLENIGFVMKWGQVVKLGAQRQVTAAD